MHRLPLRLALALGALLLLPACASAPRTAPADATRLTLTSSATPAELWAAAARQFTLDGWTVEDADAGRLAFVATRAGYDAALDVDVEEDVRGGRVGTGRLVIERPEGPGGTALFRAAAGVLGSLRGRISYD